MRETPDGWTRRSGSAYAPPPPLRRLGRMLAPDEPCPTLFRYPGPLGLASLLAGATTRLGPGATPFVWLAASAAAMPGSTLFGVVAILDPLRLQPCEADPQRGFWLALDAAVHQSDAAAAWVPPSAVTRTLPWDTLRHSAELREAVGAGYAEEQLLVRDALGAYLEELSALHAAGAAGPARPWHLLSREARQRLLAGHGIEGRWTR